MTSSNGNIFRVTGPLCGEFTGPGEFPTQRPVTRSFDVYFDLRLNKRLSKHSWGWWFETLSWSLWRHHNGLRWQLADLYHYKDITRASWILKSTTPMAGPQLVQHNKKENIKASHYWFIVSGIHRWQSSWKASNDEGTTMSWLHHIRVTGDRMRHDVHVTSRKWQRTALRGFLGNCSQR